MSLIEKTAYAKSIKRNDPPAVEWRTDSEDGNYTKTEILVKFDEDARPKQILRSLGIDNRRVACTLGGDKLLAAQERKHRRHTMKEKSEHTVRGKKYRSLEEVPESELALEAYDRLPAKEQELFRWNTITFNGEVENIPELIEQIKLHPDVENAQPNYIYAPCEMPNDPYYHSAGSWGQDYADMWNVHKIKAYEAWEVVGPASFMVNPDVNGDGVVDFYDYAIVADNWLNVGGSINPVDADITQDEVVNFQDISKIASRWLRPVSNVVGEPVVVAVIDTGLDYNHPDIFDNVWVNPGEVCDNNDDGVIDLHDIDTNGDNQVSEAELAAASNGVDDDGNHLTDDIMGWNFNRDDIPPEEEYWTREYGDFTGDNNPMDIKGHGTHVAGTIAAVGNNNQGIIGVAPQAKIMPLRVQDFTESNIVYALYYAAQNGAKVMNNIWSSIEHRPSAPVFEDTMEVLADEYDCVVVFAAGNHAGDIEDYSPNNHPKVLKLTD